MFKGVSMNRIFSMLCFTFIVLSSNLAFGKDDKCDRNILSLCEGHFKSNHYVYFCSDISRLYLKNNCQNKDDVIRKDIRVMFEACENDFGEYCIRSKKRNPKEGVACIKEYKNKVSRSCKRKIKPLFEHLN